MLLLLLLLCLLVLRKVFAIIYIAFCYLFVVLAQTQE